MQQDVWRLDPKALNAKGLGTWGAKKNSRIEVLYDEWIPPQHTILT